MAFIIECNFQEALTIDLEVLDDVNELNFLDYFLGIALFGLGDIEVLFLGIFLF